MKHELSEFLKTAYEHGKIKDLKDAFIEYSPEEEWHKGNAENWIKKKIINGLNILKKENK